jgi:glycosyltransferase involved in cell wall biosynthesis
MHFLALAPGCSVHSQRFVELLLADGHTVTAMDAVDPLAAGAPPYRFVPLPRPIRGMGRLGRWFANLERRWRIGRLRRLWKKIRPDVVHVQWVDDRAWLCAQAGVRPLVLHCWGSDINNFFGAPVGPAEGREKVRFSLRSADLITADTREVLARCEELAGAPLRTQLYRLGVDVPRFARDYSEQVRDLRRRLGIPPGQKVLLSVRRLHPGLGQEDIVRAFATVSRDLTLPGTVLVFRRYLAEPEYESHLKSLVRELRVQANVAWLDGGSYDDVPVQYAMADLVVNYPEQDAFPVSLCEAAASKRPVVSSDLPAYQGLFERGLVLVPPKRADLLADALRHGLRDAAAAGRRAERAYAAVLDIGDQFRNVQQLGRVCASLCEPREQPSPLPGGQRGAELRTRA